MASNGGLRYNAGKVRVDLIPPRWVIALAEVLTKGAEKYAERNWEEGMDWGHCYAAAQRHLLQFWDGEEFDHESQLNHLAHAAWNCLALLTYFEDGLGTDTRPGSPVEPVSKSVFEDGWVPEKVPAPEDRLPLTALEGSPPLTKEELIETTKWVEPAESVTWDPISYESHGFRGALPGDFYIGFSGDVWVRTQRRENDLYGWNRVLKN